MKEPIPQNNTKSQSTPASHAILRKTRSAGEPAGEMAQLFSAANSSPQVQAQFRLSEELRSSPQVRSQSGLAALINQGEPFPTTDETGIRHQGNTIGPGTGVVQGVFVYSFPKNKIYSDEKSAEYYREAGLQQYRSADGYLVWADSRNADKVRMSTISPGVVARENYRPQPTDGTVQDVMEDAQYVDQDYGVDRYYIGMAAAYTYNLATCTAIAMFHPPTGLSYLKHADAETSSESVRASVTEYIETARESCKGEFNIQDIEVTIYATAGEENLESSFENIRNGIAEIPAAPELVVDLFEHAAIVEDSQREHHIVVGGERAPRVVDPGHAYSTLEYALQKIADGESEAGTIYGSTFAAVVEAYYKRWDYRGVVALGAALINDAAAEATEGTRGMLERMAQGQGPPEEEPEEPAEELD